MTKAKPRLTPQPPLQTGQIWRMAGSRLQIGLVGKLLVHYKLGKPDAIRVPNQVGSKNAVEGYLKEHNAVLMRKKPTA
jgi:hypothetical protein